MIRARHRSRRHDLPVRLGRGLAIRRTVFGSATKFWPRSRRGASECSASRSLIRGRECVTCPTGESGRGSVRRSDRRASRTASVCRTRSADLRRRSERDPTRDDPVVVEIDHRDLLAGRDVAGEAAVRSAEVAVRGTSDDRLERIGIGDGDLGHRRRPRTAGRRERSEAARSRSARSADSTDRSSSRRWRRRRVGRAARHRSSRRRRRRPMRCSVRSMGRLG